MANIRANLSAGRARGKPAYRRRGEDLELSRRLKKLAGETGKRLVILHRHPVLTSARRARRFTLRTRSRILFCLIFDPHHTTTSRDAARSWQDGRR